MQAAHKNSFLQSATPIDPRIINRTVDLARSKAVTDQFDSLSPFNRVVTEQPYYPVKNHDVTRRPLGFGRTAMPKLRRELHSKDPQIQMQAVNTVYDVVHDPERNFEAIKLRFPDRLMDLLNHEDPAIRERVCMSLTTMCRLLDGKYAIAKNKKMMTTLLQILSDEEPTVRLHSIMLIESLAAVWMTADILVDNGYIELLINKLKYYSDDDPCVPHYLQTLEYLTYCNGKFIALECGLYQILLAILDITINEEVISKTLKMLSILTQTPDGKDLALRSKLLKKLNIYLQDERPSIYENAAAAMLFSTVKTEAVLKAIKLPNLFERLITLAKNHHEPFTQKYCMQILTNLCAHSYVLKEIVEKRYEEIDAIYVGDDEHAKRIKAVLLHDMVRF